MKLIFSHYYFSFFCTHCVSCMRQSLFWMPRAYIWQANEWDVKYDTESAMQSYCADSMRQKEDIKDPLYRSYIICVYKFILVPSCHPENNNNSCWLNIFQTLIYIFKHWFIRICVSSIRLNLCLIDAFIINIVLLYYVWNRSVFPVRWPLFVFLKGIYKKVKE